MMERWNDCSEGGHGCPLNLGTAAFFRSKELNRGGATRASVVSRRRGDHEFHQMPLIYGADGMMENWNTGIVGVRMIEGWKTGILESWKSAQYSIIPLFPCFGFRASISDFN
jgi:hypothetical protein